MLVTTLPSPLIHHPPAYLPPSLSTPSLTTTLSLPPSPSPPPLLLPFPPSSSDLPGRMSASPQGLKSLDDDLLGRLEEDIKDLGDPPGPIPIH